jgi:hypothetical protein
MRRVCQKQTHSEEYNFSGHQNIIFLTYRFLHDQSHFTPTGVSDYGLFSVIYGTVAFFVFIVSAMNDSVQRFISINLGNNDYIAVSNTIKNSVLIIFLAE